MQGSVRRMEKVWQSVLTGRVSGEADTKEKWLLRDAIGSMSSLTATDVEKRTQKGKRGADRAGGGMSPLRPGIAVRLSASPALPASPACDGPER